MPVKTLNVTYSASTVTETELCNIPRIGMNVAQQIVDLRNKGKFNSLDDLKGIPGMGVKKLETLGEYLSFDSSKVTAKSVETTQKKEKKEKVKKEDPAIPEESNKDSVTSNEDQELEELLAMA